MEIEACGGSGRTLTSSLYFTFKIMLILMIMARNVTTIMGTMTLMKIIIMQNTRMKDTAALSLLPEKKCRLGSDKHWKLEMTQWQLRSVGLGIRNHL